LLVAEAHHSHPGAEMFLTEWIRLSIGGREMTTARSLAEVIHIERGYCAAPPRELAPGSHFSGRLVVFRS
jgi:hypothetical protein